MKDNRSLRSTLQQPKQQLKVSIFLSAFVSVMFCAFVLINLNVLQQTVLDLASEAHISPGAVDNINRSFTIMTIVTLFFGAAAVSIGFLLGLTLTTRLFGPVVSIRRLVANFTEGNYSARGELRKTDDFQDVVQDLNTLGATLEQRYGQKT
jgi:signal transduction histidine kinase